MAQSLLDHWHQFFQAWMEADVRTLTALLSTRPEVTWVGPEPQVFWQGRATIVDGWRQRAALRPRETLETQHLDVYTGTDWGLVVYGGATGASLLRVSSLWVREADAWRLFMLHADWGELRQAAGQLTGTRQTMRTWARLLEGWPQVPTAYRAALAARLEPQAPFPYAVLVPAFTEGELHLPEQLLFAQDDVLHILSREGDQVTACAYGLADVCSVEMGVVLLVSWLTVEGRTTEGEWRTTTLAFNTASSGLILPLVQRLRAAGPLTKLAGKPPSLAALPDKFVHYVQESLLPGEQILAWLWRPDITLDAALASLWPFYAATRANHLTVLVDRELILIWDKVTETTGDEEGYGAVWRYIPLHHITDVSVREDRAGTPHLVVTLCEKVAVERLFTPNQRIELEELAQMIDTARLSLR